MIAYSTGAARRQLCRLSMECRQHAQSLLHQQLYVLGRDITTERGNQLLDYGCDKITSVLPAIPSIYIHGLSRMKRPSSDGSAIDIDWGNCCTFAG